MLLPLRWRHLARCCRERALDFFGEMYRSDTLSVSSRKRRKGKAALTADGDSPEEALDSVSILPHLNEWEHFLLSGEEQLEAAK